jgi:peptidyl-prolyl cis-trans isomerase A (cyclophilin A)
MGEHVVQLLTEVGTIGIALASTAAPITSNNFLRYVRAGDYDGGAFFRVVRSDAPGGRAAIDVIQARVASPQLTPHPPIVLENTGATGLRHVRGTISMARSSPESATWGFFIVVHDSLELDFDGSRHPDGLGYAAFGSIFSGLDIVDAIHRQPANGELLQCPIQIFKAEVKCA